MDKEELTKLFEDVKSNPIILKSRLANSQLFGDWNSSFIGEGFDFEELREYVPGDSPRRIHIGATLRAGKTIIVKKKEQKESRATVALDLSPSMFLRKKINSAYSAAVMIFLNALKQRVPCGMFIVGKNHTVEVLPQLGDKHLFRVKEALQVSICQDISLAKGLKRKRLGNLALRTWRGTLPQGSYVFIISDFLGRSNENLLSLLDERLYGYKVVPIVVQDELEYSFPTNLPRGRASVEMFNVETGDIESVMVSHAQAQNIALEHEERFSDLNDLFFKYRLLWAHVKSSDLDEIRDTLQRSLHQASKR